jgi:tRNA G18 (ribose-2'-O)-methylase SpoU
MNNFIAFFLHYSNQNMRENGYFGIGIMNPKTEMNVGSLWRSANILGASFIFTIGTRIAKQQSDTSHAFKSIPFYYYKTFEEFYDAMPYDCRLVGVELDERSEKIETYTHLSRCIYILGAEDIGLTAEARKKCHQMIELPNGMYNVSNSGCIVMYDRHLKSALKQ